MQTMAMAFFFFFFFFWVASSLTDFTVITSDSSSPLVDAPQQGFSSHARTDDEEQRAVYEIMRATGNSWASSVQDVCRGRWHGIECMPDRNDVFHVVSLSFGALSLDTAFPVCDQLTSTLTPALVKLTHLRTLFFYQCSSLNPTLIPSFLSELAPSLKTLVLRENGHVGPIPADLSKLSNLKVLDLHGNKLSSFVPPSLASLSKLRMVDLSGNKLTGDVPRFGSAELRVVDLNGNDFHGQIPPEIGACRGLIKLDLSKNKLVGVIPSSVSELDQLILLDLSNNQLSGPFPGWLSSLKSLKTLVLSGNDMSSGTINGEAFNGMGRLTTLVLSDMGLHGPIPSSIGLLSSLRVLHLDGNSLRGPIPESFRCLSDLSELKVNDNQLTGPLPFSRKVMWRMGIKLRAANNKGLCYMAETAAEAAPPYLAGVPVCGHATAAAMVAAVPMASPGPVAAADKAPRLRRGG
ncbi:leucine-rich repeat (LRR) family protein [Wolffia australiana]